jgi:tripartite-type tricarboxylate transporter receptor subunit TctC
MAAIGPSLYLDQVIGKKEVKFDWAKFGWVGSTENTPWLFYMNTNTPYKTIDDVRKAKEAPKCSATSSGTSGHFIPKLLDEAFGAKFNVIMGYQGGSEQDLAFERGEVVCRALSIPTFFAREPFTTWRKKNMVRILLQTGRKRDPKMPDVPTIHELMTEHKTPESTRALVTAILASGDLGRPFITPPAIPADRLKILREAFRKTMADPAFLADVKTRKFEIEPDYGEQLEALAKEIVAQPKEIADRMKKLLTE